MKNTKISTLRAQLKRVAERAAAIETELDQEVARESAENAKRVRERRLQIQTKRIARLHGIEVDDEPRAVDTTEAVAEFVRRFDSGEWPELDLNAGDKA